MKKRLVNHLESEIDADMVTESKKLVSGLENVFMSSGDAWPLGSQITRDDVKKMVADCNLHFRNNGHKMVSLADVTYGQLN